MAGHAASLDVVAETLPDAILDIEAEAAAAPNPDPLDVERLARALGSVVPEPDDEHEYTVTDDLWYAAAIAREYAKEPQP